MTDVAAFPFAICPGVGSPPEYAAARQRAELTEVLLSSGRRARIATRYADVRFVLADRRFSRSAYAGTLFARSTDSLPLITTDAPVHSRRRAAVAHAFTARSVRAMRPMVRELAEKQIADLAPGADLVAEFSVPFTLRVMCRVLGVPDEDMALFKPWVDPMMSISRYPADEVARCHREFHDYFARLVDQVARDPRPGLVGDLLAPRNPERVLSREEVVILSAGLLVAGYETTSNVLAVVLLQLLRDPELLRRAATGFDDLLEEILRYLCGNGTGGVPHVATEQVRLPSGAVVPAGAVVVPIPDAANHDPAVFADPERLDPDRVDNPHIAFGFGAHYCLGAELARMELRVAIPALLTALPGLRLAVDEADLRWRTDMFVRGVWELPVTW
ncbi:cytochrome P450 [Actinokineospora sp. NPDC004072]